MKSNHPIQAPETVVSLAPEETVVSVVPDRNYRERWLRVVLWCGAIVLGFLNIWPHRHTFTNLDGISYLDVGDAYFRGDWGTAINAYWSPLYSWLLGLGMFVLKPSPYWEFSVLHLINFLIYLCALGCYDFFLSELIRHQRQATGLSQDGRMGLPKWAWLALGYSLFLWSSLVHIVLYMESPDMCVAAFVYLISGILLRIRMGRTGQFTFVVVGAVLGFAYLAKAAMFPLAFLFLLLSLFLVGNLSKAIIHGLTALVVFFLVAGPFIVALSKAKGRLTFGDTGKLNYVWFVNCVGNWPDHWPHWQGELPGNGTPKHPARKIFDEPTVYEFRSPVGGTYPMWYDPSYWWEGVAPYFNPIKQITRMMLSVNYYYSLFFFNPYNPHFFNPQSGLLVGLLTLYFVGGQWRLCVKDLAQHWSLLVPAIAALGMYALVYIEPRYVGAFIVLLWLGAFSGLRLPKGEESRRLMMGTMLAMMVIMILAISIATAREAYATARHLIKRRDTVTHVHWQIANSLKQMGVQAGDQVAIIGSAQIASPWARLARVRIVAETPVADQEKFWAAEDAVKSQVMESIASTGVKIIVAKAASNIPPAGWQKIGNTGYYVYFLPR